MYAEIHRQSTSFSESLLVVLYSILARKLHSGCCLSTVKHLVLRKTSRSRPASERAAAVGVSRTDGRRFPLSPPSMRAAVYRRQTQQAPAFRHQVGALSLSLSLRVMLILSHAAGRRTWPRPVRPFLAAEFMLVDNRADEVSIGQLAVAATDTDARLSRRQRRR